VSTDHANLAAATTAGYKESVCDRGASAPAATRFEVTLEKWVVGEAFSCGGMLRAFGQGSTQANAEAAALASLNAQRQHHYGGAPGRASGSANSVGPHGGTMTEDAS
jgi:hypothetical protein